MLYPNYKKLGGLKMKFIFLKVIVFTNTVSFTIQKQKF